MRAAVVQKPGEITVTTVEDPKPGPRQVVIAVDGCGICGTDIHLIDGELPYRPYPIIPGHEFAGEVVSVGVDVTEFRAGDRVAPIPTSSAESATTAPSGVATSARTTARWASPVTVAAPNTSRRRSETATRCRKECHWSTPR